MIDFTRYTYEEILKGALTLVPDDIDKREGSIIYDALAPACYQLAGFYIELANMLEASFIGTSYGEYLDRKVAEQGLKRIPASKAVKKGYFTDNKGAVNLSLGTRFSSIGDDALIYMVIDTYQIDGESVPGTYLLECETEGSVGNRYTGDLLPVSHINLETAVMQDLIIPARDEETDEDLRERYMENVSHKPFGGNIAQYRKEIRSLDGVGDLQIYPVWDGGGTVKCSIVGADYRSISDDLINDIQEQVDPHSDASGLGIAPIGHTVTICTPIETIINISCKISLLMGHTTTQLHPYIVDRIGKYLESLRKNWADADALNQYGLTVYNAQILSAILSVPGVANVADVRINGSPGDLTLREDAMVQEIPVLGEVAYGN